MDKEKLKNMQGQTEQEFLQGYDASVYDRPSVTADMLIFSVMDEERESYRKLPEKSLKLLLIKRGNHPHMGKWALPGGFVAVNESVDAAAIRELKTETNIDGIYMEQLYTWGEVDRDPRTRVISCSYLALVDSSSLNVKAGDDADDARWLNVDYSVFEEKKTISEKGFLNEKLISLTLLNEADTLKAVIKVSESYEGRSVRLKREIVNSDGIAFDHAKIIEYAIERLRNKVEYTDIAFNLMPELFTLSELQQVYEIISGKELLAAAFRRKIAPMVIETDEYTKDAGHRPSKLYKFNPNWRNV